VKIYFITNHQTFHVLNLADKHLQIRDGRNHIALLSAPIVWWRKPWEGLDGHGTCLCRVSSPNGPFGKRSLHL